MVEIGPTPGLICAFRRRVRPSDGLQPSPAGERRALLAARAVSPLSPRSSVEISSCCSFVNRE